VTDINCDVPTAVVTAAVVTTAAWSARAGASGPRSAFPGTSVPGAGTGPVGLVRPVPHVRPKAAAVSHAGAVAALGGLTNNYIQMTSVFVSGEDTSDPPPDREPA
jgi:hypothetical protein